MTDSIHDDNDTPIGLRIGCFNFVATDPDPETVPMLPSIVAWVIDACRAYQAAAVPVADQHTFAVTSRKVLAALDAVYERSDASPNPLVVSTIVHPDTMPDVIPATLSPAETRAWLAASISMLSVVINNLHWRRAFRDEIMEQLDHQERCGDCAQEVGW
jgi:hypothetical protein